MRVIEKQSEKLVRTYELDGPRWETVKGFWEWLLQQGVIVGYWIEEE